MATEKFPCGCAVDFRPDGQIGGVVVCEKHADVFSENKSLKQLALDIHHQQLQDKHKPKPPAEPPAPGVKQPA